MPGHYLRTGYTSIQVMCRDLVADMLASGFTLLTAYTANAQGLNTAPAYDQNTYVYVLAPTTAVDPLCVEVGQTSDPNYSRRQPWRIVIEVLDGEHYINFWICTPTQVIQAPNGTISVSAYAVNGDTVKQSGFLVTENIYKDDAKTNFFFRRFRLTTGPTVDGAQTKVWPCHVGDDLDYEALPLSYTVSITDHGIAFSMWAEAFDKSGNCFNWWTVQRFVKDDGQILLDEKSPLICMFSQNGGGHADGNTLIDDGILYFVVCEADINAPTSPMSAVRVSADSFPFINPIQQVGIMVNGNYVLHFPRGVNTQRYYYPYRLDMMGYASADVLSQRSNQNISLYGQARRYLALNANSLNNKGVRMIIIAQGAGIV